MKYSITHIILFFAVNTFLAQTPNWHWAKSASGNFTEEILTTVTDNQGNVIAAGFFEDASITFGTTTLTNSHTSHCDIFIVKYDTNGTVLWAKSFGGNAWDDVHSITTDAANNIIVVGGFNSSTIGLGATTLSNSDVPSHDLFIAKYDTNGNLLWAKSFGAQDDDYGTSAAIDGMNNIFVSGTFENTQLVFGANTTIYNTNSNGSADIFIAKFDSAGNIIWAQAIGGSSNDEVMSITCDLNGNVYIAGQYAGASISTGSITTTNTSYTGIGYSGFIAKYSTNGTPLWAESVIGGGNLFGSGLNNIKADTSGNIFVTGGYYNASITIGGLTISNTDLSGNTSDAFIAKYSPTGNIKWIKNLTGSDNEGISSIAVTTKGEVIVLGFFMGASYTDGTTSLNNTDATGISTDLFIEKFDTNSSPLWLISAGGNYFDYPYSISTDLTGNIYAAGSFASPSILFGTTQLYNSNSTAFTNPDLFIVKLSNSNYIASVPAISKNNYSVYPNPATESLCLKTNEVLNGEVTIEIINNNGQTVKREQTTNLDTYSINISNLINGVYSIKATNGNKVLNQKFVKLNNN
ncbi:MAG: T9SS type A sorting domain-containing protein [Bacteroidetes bacterium]|nr:T9SS type A sorting domain-containing protein [Bacteroidota bacterium]